MSDFFQTLGKGLSAVMPQQITNLVDFGLGLFGQDFMNEKQNERALNNQMIALEYNDPVNQMKRLAKAGINPLSVNGVQNFQAQAVTPPSSSAPQMRGADVNQSSLLVSQRQAQDIDNMSKSALNIATLQKLRFEALETLSKTKMNDTNRRYTEKTIKWYDELILGQLNLMKSQQVYNDSLIGMNSLEMQNFGLKMNIMRGELEVAKQNANANTRNANTNYLNYKVNDKNADTNRGGLMLQEKYYNIHKAMSAIEMIAKRRGIELTKKEIKLVEAKAVEQMKRNKFIELDECLKVVDTTGRFIGNLKGVAVGGSVPAPTYSPDWSPSYSR